jgi:CheY-like chemotaxis protein
MQNILIVDDVQTDRELLGAVVSKSGHHPVYANDGAQALEIAQQSRPALIFLDVVMPTQDGFKTCRTLKAAPETSHIPVVLVTSKNADSDKFWGKKQGADEHVGKPYSQERIVDLIRRYVR